MEEWGFLRGCRYLLHDRDTKFCASFRERIESGSVKKIRLQAMSPNLNSVAERLGEIGQRGMPVEDDSVWGSVHCGERCSNMWCITTRSATTRGVKENLILFPLQTEGARNRRAAVRCRERLGGLLKYYEREAA